MKNTTWKSNYFFGKEVSEYGKEHGYIDYTTLASAFNCVLNNSIIEVASANNLYFEPVNGSEIYFEDSTGNIYTEEEKEEKVEELESRLAELEELEELTEKQEEEKEELKEDVESLEDEHYDEIFQYFIISEAGYNILSDYTDEIVFYNSELDMYVWGVTHWGTSWDYVLTNIKIELEED